MIVISHLFHSLKVVFLFLTFRPYFHATFTGGFPHTYLPPAFPRNLYGRIPILLPSARISTQSLRADSHTLIPRPYFHAIFTGGFPHAYSSLVFPCNLYGRIPTRLLPACISTQPLRADSHTLTFRPHFHATFTGGFPHTYSPPVFPRNIKGACQQVTAPFSHSSIFLTFIYSHFELFQ